MEELRVQVVFSSVLENRGKPLNCPRGAQEGSPQVVTLLIARLKGLYISGCNVGDKQEELEAMVQFED